MLYDSTYIKLQKQAKFCDAGIRILVTFGEVKEDTKGASEVLVMFYFLIDLDTYDLCTFCICYTQL